MTSAEIAVVGLVCLDIVQSVQLGQDTEQQQRHGWLVPGAMLNLFSPSVFSGGGCVSNTGLAAFKMLSGRTSLVANLGADNFGDVLRKVLLEEASGGSIAAQQEKLKVLFKHLRSDPALATAYSFVLQPSAFDRSILHNGSANHSFRPLLDCKAFIDEQMQLPEQQRCKAFHFGYPSFMRTTAADGGVALTTLLATVKKRIGATTSIDMAHIDDAADYVKVVNSQFGGWRGYLARCLPVTDIFLPSVDELAAMLGMEKGLYLPSSSQKEQDKILSLSEVRKMGRVCCEELGSPIVVIKCGAHGCYLRTTSRISRLEQCGALFPTTPVPSGWVGVDLFSHCFAVKVAGTVGAGDCAVAGFLSSLIRGVDEKKIQTASPFLALKAAVAAGAFCVESMAPTAGVPFGFEKLLDRAIRNPPPLLLPEKFSGCAIRLSDADKQAVSVVTGCGTAESNFALSFNKMSSVSKL